ncbi:MAG: hypothetical protein LBR89_03780 [Holosporales bacterium]|jgi:hypothetical protein|nr:hypothetical protein [Holosporales bacterium]
MKMKFLFAFATLVAAGDVSFSAGPMKFGFDIPRRISGDELVVVSISGAKVLECNIPQDYNAIEITFTSRKRADMPRRPASGPATERTDRAGRPRVSFPGLDAERTDRADRPRVSFPDLDTEQTDSADRP